MQVFVLYRYWDTPDNEGSDVLGAFYDVENAISSMNWDEDMTWEDDFEIHLGRDSHTPYEPATVYCWTIAKLDVQ